MRSMPGDCPAARAVRLLARGQDWLEAVRHAEEALDSDPCRRDALCVWRALATLVHSGELVAADARCHDLAGREDVQDTVLVIRGRVARLCGDLDGAGGLFDRVLRTAAGPEVRLAAAGSSIELWLERGEPERAVALLDEYDVDAALGGRPMLRAARGAVSLAMGDFGPALADYLAAGRELATRGVTNPAVLPWRRKAAVAAHSAGHRRAAAKLARQEYTAAVRWGEPRTVGCALAAVALTDQHAAELLTEAAELLEVAHARVELAEVRHELGLCLAAAGDFGGARDELERARTLFTEVGSPHRAERVTHALSRLRPRVELTARESRIAGLARAGYTNKQIAAKLFLAQRTVELHLSRVYRKLGVSGRGELRAAE